jgi:hypothetical protein
VTAHPGPIHATQFDPAIAGRDLTLGVAVRLRDEGKVLQVVDGEVEPQCLRNALAGRASDQADELLELAGMLAR